VDIKLNILQDAHTIAIPENLMGERHAKNDMNLARRLLINYGAMSPDEEQCYVDAAKACREVRERMNRHSCQGKCMKMIRTYNTLLPTLETLQRRAYEEVRLKVSTAIGQRLPTELSFLAFEHIMASEGVPLYLEFSSP
jgi:hypothetical protein